MGLSKVELYILYRLFVRRSFCKNHISETDLKKNIVPFKAKPEEFKDAIKNLRNLGFLNPVRKKEMEYCLFPKKITEVKQFLSKFLGITLE